MVELVDTPDLESGVERRGGSTPSMGTTLDIPYPWSYFPSMTTPVEMKHPDPKKHLVVSLMKSGIRIIGYLLLFGIPSSWAYGAAIVLIASEVVGIVEELV